MNSSNLPTVSVVVIAYNDAGLVGEAVSSALAQGPVVAEVIAVNDASSDGTARVLDELAAVHPRLKVVHRTENSGGAAPRATTGSRLLPAGTCSSSTATTSCRREPPTPSCAPPRSTAPRSPSARRYGASCPSTTTSRGCPDCTYRAR